VGLVPPAGQPLAEPGRGEPVSAVLAVEAGQERQADRGVDLLEQADRAGEDVAQVSAQLVSQADTVADQVLAGAACAAQRDGRRAVRGQRAQPGTVGAQSVSEHERVEAVVLVPADP
jgi:hypothetical protein